MRIINPKESMKVLSIILFICLFNEAIWCAQKNDLNMSSADIGQRLTEAECMANTKQIRDIIKRMSENKKVSRSILQNMHTALDKNRVCFEKSKENGNLSETLFGEGIAGIDDYDLFWKVKDVFILNVKEKLDTKSFAASVWMSTSLRNVVQDNAEWSEYLYEIVIDFALASPLTMVKYLYECPQDEFDSTFSWLEWIYDAQEKRKELESALVQISVNEKKYAKTVDRIINRMKEDCIKYYGADAEVCKN